MKKVSELIGEDLNLAVAKCKGYVPLSDGISWIIEVTGVYRQLPKYSTDWSQGGPIIEREWLQVTPWPNESDEDMRWHCVQHGTPMQCHAYGPTALIAAMRCYVASVLGDEIELNKISRIL